jgi:ornithine--oxo-acid transaminase
MTRLIAHQQIGTRLQIQSELARFTRLQFLDLAEALQLSLDHFPFSWVIRKLGHVQIRLKNERAPALLQASGVEARCEVVGGSFFEGVPPGADAYLLRAILHDWDDERSIVRIPFNDLPALERALAHRQMAAFVVEPIQGKGVNVPDDGYLAGAQDLCRKYGTLLVADEIQTGLGRTGRFLAIDHWGVEPDIVLVSKTLSGGHVPVAAVLTRKWIFDKVFDRMERAVIHSSTFGTNDLAMAAGIATLDVLESERLIENAARLGARLLSSFKAMASRYEMIKEVRGKGLMIGVEFGQPRSLKLQAAWRLLEAVNQGLFCQLITLPLFKDHRILVQVAGHASHTVKLLPALVISDDDCEWIERSFSDVIADSHRVPAAVWSLGKTLTEHALKARANHDLSQSSS